MTKQSMHPPPGTWNACNLLTVLEVTELALVHLKTVYRWIKDGKLEAFQHQLAVHYGAISSSARADPDSRDGKSVSGSTVRFSPFATYP